MPNLILPPNRQKHSFLFWTRWWALIKKISLAFTCVQKWLFSDWI